MTKHFFDTTMYAEIKKYIESKLENRVYINLDLYEVEGKNVFTIYLEDTDVKIIFSSDIVLLSHISELDSAVSYLKNRIELLTY